VFPGACLGSVEKGTILVPAENIASIPLLPSSLPSHHTDSATRLKYVIKLLVHYSMKLSVSKLCSVDCRIMIHAKQLMEWELAGKTEVL
jgi:hypothetical protein